MVERILGGGMRILDKKEAMELVNFTQELKVYHSPKIFSFSPIRNDELRREFLGKLDRIKEVLYFVMEEE